MSSRKRWMPPEDVQRIVARAQDHEPCEDCDAMPGQPCGRPGPGRTVHKYRFVAAAIALKREARQPRQTPEQAAQQAAILASLPRVPREEIEACRTPKGGYSFTGERLAAWGVPWPPPAGWAPGAAARRRRRRRGRMNAPGTCPCGSPDARLYAEGWRCPAHTPAARAGRPEPDSARYCAAARCYCGQCPSWTPDTAYHDGATVVDARAIASGKRRASLTAYRDAQAQVHGTRPGSAA